ncbi:MAG TPA: hypothetical protein DF296_01050 [Candidatus Margulisbacteria bacterium]|nr:MAG: hypothetical protein A2X42_05390 [Candidatus Margulisbacteria bacterium GWF2_38_17]OGI09001.1 MAG: hypothetical protein A2X41_01585 [Candidatus Margulisbacteria bacterium GWE2_39_32]HCT83769.1 hypothetical protein [Candidatus Margulisiibacteriota bacterium]
MDLKLTKEQCFTLTKMLYVATFVCDGFAPDQLYEDMAELQKYVLLSTRDYQRDVGIPCSENLPGEQAYDEELCPIIDRFQHDAFWDHLTDKMVNNELRNQFTLKKFSALSLEEKLILRLPLTEKYENEFEENGVQNLVIQR